MIQLVAVDPGQFWEFADVHPDYVHFHDATSRLIFVDPQVGSLSIDGSEVWGYYSGVDPQTGEALNSINEEQQGHSQFHLAVERDRQWRY